MTFARLISHAAPYRVALGIIALLMLVQTASVLVLPWLGGQLAAGFLAEGKLAEDALDTDLILIGIIVLFGVRSVLAYAVSWKLADTAARIVTDLRQSAYERVQMLPLGYFRARRQGDILSSVVYEPQYLSQFLTMTLPSFVPNGLAVLGALGLMAGIDPLLASLVVGLMPLFYLSVRLIGRGLRPLASRLRDAHADLVSIVDENLSMIPAIKGFTRETPEARRHLAIARQVQALEVQQARLQAFLDGVIRFLAVVAMVGILRLLGERVTGDSLSLPEFVSFLLYAAVLTSPFAELSGVWGQTQRARGALTRLQDVLGEPPESAAGLPQMTPIVGRIRFQDVHLTYTGRHAALRGANLDIAAGQTVALVGPNGAGKSTLINLLMMFDRPQKGRVMIDDFDIAEVDLQSLRCQIAVLSQTVLLFNTTIRENIAYGGAGENGGASEAEIEQAARRAQAHDFVVGLPEGYDTVIGDRGVRLSGGQAQRIALARALLKDPAILVLDEPTAMFDPEGEDAFIADARAAFADRTVLLITHRPGSLALADRIVTLNDGVVTGDTGGDLRG